MGEFLLSESSVRNLQRVHDEVLGRGPDPLRQGDTTAAAGEIQKARCKADIANGESGTIAFLTGTSGEETEDGEQTCLNRTGAGLRSDVEVIVTIINGEWEVIAVDWSTLPDWDAGVGLIVVHDGYWADASKLSNYDNTFDQALIHASGVLQWSEDIGDC